MGLIRIIAADARHGQIIALSSFLALGLIWFGFPVGAGHIAACFAGALGAQFMASRIWRVSFDWRSPVISALSLTLLLRSGEPWLAVLAASVAILSKFVIRWRGKHIFNPANFGLVMAALCFPAAWISPGQWGSGMLILILFAVAGLIVSGRAGRWDVALAFLLSYAGILFGRALWYGDPLSIPVHQLQSGALLLFAFFMISDPKTTPDHRFARLIYGGLVASIGAVLVFAFYRSGGVIQALLLTAPLVPLLDHWLPAAQYQWRQKGGTDGRGRRISL